MKEDQLVSIIDKSFNAYELVQNLKRIKRKGYRYVQYGDEFINIGKLMWHIVDMSRMHYSYEHITSELLIEKSFYE